MVELDDPMESYEPLADPLPWYKRPTVWLAAVWTVELTLLVILNA
jgi:hypothetical protein